MGRCDAELALCGGGGVCQSPDPPESLLLVAGALFGGGFQSGKLADRTGEVCCDVGREAGREEGREEERLLGDGVALVST